MATKTGLTQVRQRKYLAKDFNAFREQLLEYAKLYYPDKIKDFSEASLGGLLLDFASYVGDTFSFYLDHQFGELSYDTAVEYGNIENLLKTAGVKIQGAAPAIAPLTFYVRVPANQNGNGPDMNSLPIIQANTICSADNGVEFILKDDINFNDTNQDGTLKAKYIIDKTVNNVPQSYILSAEGEAISGKEKTETFTIGNEFVPFKRLSLEQPNVSEIISMKDDLGNDYYEVSNLTDDTIYLSVLNTKSDAAFVKNRIKPKLVPYRYVTDTTLATRQTTIILGGGNAESFEDDALPDPTSFAISLPYTKTFSKIAINPSSMLNSKTLGVYNTNTTMTVTYRYGGGLNHSVKNDSIKSIKLLNMTFPGDVSSATASAIRGSTEVTNLDDASGGEDAMTIDELKQLIPSMKNSQERMVTAPDVIARIYSLPTTFGRIFRTSVHPDPNNRQASNIYVISRNDSQQLVISPDTLKENLKNYLTPYRQLSDTFNILDAKIINIGCNFEVMIDPLLNKSLVLQQVLIRLKDYFNIKNFTIDQPIIRDDILSLISNVQGIMSINSLIVNNIVTNVGSRTYSNVSFNIPMNTINNVIVPPIGSIFEIKYPNYDIIGKVVT